MEDVVEISNLPGMEIGSTEQMSRAQSNVQALSVQSALSISLSW